MVQLLKPTIHRKWQHSSLSSAGSIKVTFAERELTKQVGRVNHVAQTLRTMFPQGFNLIGSLESQSRVKLSEVVRNEESQLAVFD